MGAEQHAAFDEVGELLRNIEKDAGGNGGSGDNGGGKGGDGGGGGKRDPFARTLEAAANYAFRLTMQLVADVQSLADHTLGNQRALDDRLDMQGRLIIALTQRIEALEAAAHPPTKETRP